MDHSVCKLDIRDLHIVLLSIYEFFLKSVGEIILHFKGIIFLRILCILHASWIKFCTEDIHKNVLLGGCEFPENVLSEIHTLVTGVKEFLFLLCTFIVQLSWNSVKGICT
jgi:hypothetical protein